jgi:hypothetical protein
MALVLLLLVPLLLPNGPGDADAELEAIAAAEVAGPVTTESLEGREGAAARLAHEIPFS